MPVLTYYTLTAPYRSPWSGPGTLAVTNQDPAQSITVTIRTHDPSASDQVVLTYQGDQFSCDLSNVTDFTITASAYPAIITLVATPLALSVSPAPIVNVAGTPTVNVSGTPSVNVSGTPSVSVTNLAPIVYGTYSVNGTNIAVSGLNVVNYNAITYQVPPFIAPISAWLSYSNLTYNTQITLVLFSSVSGSSEYVFYNSEASAGTSFDGSITNWTNMLNAWNILGSATATWTIRFQLGSYGPSGSTEYINVSANIPYTLMG